MKYFSMFSGIGGFELGIQRALDNEHAHISQESEQEERSQGRKLPTDQQEVLLHAGDGSAALCVGYSEIDTYAIKTYEEHFDHDNYGDATKINPADLPDFDLLVGGFPCQAFSVAGKRRGFDDTRGTLFFDIARILSDKRPRHLVLENVKGLLSHDSGKTFQTIIGVLTDLGYFVEWQVLNSKDFGVPQNRERVFIVGHLGGEPRRKVFPIFGTDGEDFEPGQTSTTINSGGGGQGAKTGLYAVRQPLRFLNRNQKNIEGDYSYTVDASQTSGVKVRTENMNGDGFWNEYTGTIRAGASRNNNLLDDTTRIRRLTPLECERLQGFPDNWTVGSDTQRYKQCGNAVTVNVVEAVIGGLLCV